MVVEKGSGKEEGINDSVEAEKKGEEMGYDEKLLGFKLPTTAKMFLACGTLVVFFLLYGVLQERLMTIPYGPDGQMFTFSAFLVLNNRVVVCTVAFAILMYQGESPRNVAPLYKYFGISFSNTLATMCQYEALKHISFPTQTLGKCGKMIPVMIISGVLGMKKYQSKDYIAALCITVGCAIFVLGGDTAPQSGRKEDSMFGILLMGGYLFFDGFTSTFQEKLFKDYKISSYNQMLYVNLTSAILSFTFLVAGNQLFDAITFTMTYPASYAAAFTLSLAACGGQITIYYIIKNFGALVFATAMVFRNVVSILLSCIIFFHPLTLYQWIAGGLVLGTYYIHSVTKKRGAKKPATEQENEGIEMKSIVVEPSNSKI
mmetsp:Transcript_34078/g.95927  ORF Transcript_34078/g.95927 Transcript_34078/m.95927 type:complete len:373 (+) Transcript_34078:49-1167(+)